MLTIATRDYRAVRKQRHHHSVYVVELHPDVWYETRFRDANPGYDGKSPCVYVGMTGLDPVKRFANHKAGIKGNRYVLALRPEAAAGVV